MYVCENAKLCVDQKKLCDGNRDCPLGDDEKNCITIKPFSQKNSDITYYSNGKFCKVIISSLTVDKYR